MCSPPTKEIKLPGWALEIYRPPDGKHERYYVIKSGRGTGKSHNIATILILLAMEAPFRIVCAREIMATIRDSSYAILVDQIKEMEVADEFDITKAEIVHKTTGAKFIFIGLRGNIEQVKSLANADICWLDEAVSITKESIDILTPTFRKDGSFFIFTYNPRFEHDAIEQYFAIPPPRTRIIKLDRLDRSNPFLSPDNPMILEMLHDYETRPEVAAHKWGGEYMQTVEGAYYTQQIQKLRHDGRICEVLYEPGLPLRAYFDLGKTDNTAVVISQFVGERINILDYFEANQQPPSFFMDWIEHKWGKRVQIILPHDGAHTHQDNPTMMSIEMQFRRAGWLVKVLKNTGAGAVLQRIQRTRENFFRVYFNNTTECKVLINWLAVYHEHKNQMGMSAGPKHDDSSHAADAFGYMSVDWRPPRALNKGSGVVIPKLGY